ncbi:hypothetical protein N7513_002596 [Penicillium frequentans]|nr:hypothetical protein N7513_002596 [Penicillium glabrum]
MATCLAQLGIFSKLPTEIRLIIWEYLISEHFFARDFGLLKKKRTPHALSISYCSRYLYEEISDLVYKDLVQVIKMTGCRGLDELSVEVSFKRQSYRNDLKGFDIIQSYLHNSRYWRATGKPLEVEIFPPYPEDRGMIVGLWRNINQFIDILQAAPYTPNVRVTLVMKWHENGKPLQSTGYHKLPRADYDIALLPFTRLSSCMVHVPPSLRTALENEPHYRHRSLLHNLIKNPTFKQSHHMAIEKCLADTRIFLDTKLDFLSGETAGVLRFQRYQNWYEDGDSWKSSYEEQFLADLTENCDIVLKYDPGLRKARHRNRVLLRIHHRFHERYDDTLRAQIDPNNMSPRLYKTWDSQAWLKRFDSGKIPELHRIEYNFDGNVEKEQLWQKYAKLSGFIPKLHWWAKDEAPLSR